VGGGICNSKIYVKLFMCTVKDVFVGFATVPGFVALTASGGSPYLQVSDFIFRTAFTDT
jgi:hypothetical protein